MIYSVYKLILLVQLTLHLGAATPVQTTSTMLGRFLENRLRFGADGGRPENVEDGLDQPPPPSQLIYRGPIEYVSANQLNGNMGNFKPPQRISHDKQLKPQMYVAPNPKLVDAPAELNQLTDLEKEAIATEFLIKYNYTFEQGLSNGAPAKIVDQRVLIKAMQKRYGLVDQSGELTDETINAMRQPRCGVPDGPAAYRTFANRDQWENRDVTYYIKGYTPDMSQCQTRNTIKRAFRVWEEVTDLTFEMVDNDNADIIIYFGYKEHGDGYPFDGQNGLLAHAFNPGKSEIAGDSHFDESEFWTLGEGRVFDTYYGNADGDPCVLPFIFEGKTYRACTSKGRDDGMEWCATTPDYDEDKRWGFCPQETLFTYGGNSGNAACKFPFAFLGKTYDSCTTDGRNDGYRWCSTTSSYDTDGKWGFCPDRAQGTTDGNSNGAGCRFPFKFQGLEYNECTTRGRADYKLWCSTTDDFDRDGKWGLCNGRGYSLFLVAAHEFGHAIGLDHSDVRGALMYPTYAYRSEFVLPDDDTRGARDLYGGPRSKPLPALKLEKCGGGSPTGKPDQTSSTSTTSTSTSATSTTKGRVRDCRGDTLPKNMCERPTDAIMLLQNERYVFQGPFLWMVTGKGKSQTRIPVRISQYWASLSCGVDAAYARPSDNKLVFFRDSQYYEYDSLSVEHGYPKEVTELGLPARSVVDGAVFMQTRNPKTRQDEDRVYYFVGREVYRANPENGIVMYKEKEFLGEAGAWKDIPADIDAVYREDLNKPYTIFVKGDTYYRYQNKKWRKDISKHSLTRDMSVNHLFQCS